MLKIIIVEDEELLRDGLTTCVNWGKLGFELAGDAPDGVEALKLIERVHPDVVITDIKMPHMDGIELSEHIKLKYPEIRIIIISGYDEFEYARRALKAGVYEYILKPVNMAQLHSVMKAAAESLLAEREKQREITRLKDISRQGVGTLRQTLFSRILLRKQTPKEAEDIVEKIEEHVKGKYYAVGILEQQNFPIVSIDCDYLEIIEMDGEFEQMVSKRMEAYRKTEAGEHVDILRSNNCERVFCIVHNSVQEVKEMIEEIQALFDVRQDDMEHLQLVFGKVAKELTGLYKSYLNAREICEKHFMENWGQILHTDGKSSSTLQYMNYDAQSLFFEVQSGTKEGIEHCLEEFHERLTKENIISYMQIVMIVSNVFFELIKLPEEVGGNIKEIIGDPMEYYHRIIEKRKRREMIGEIGKVCMLIHEYFVSVSGAKMQGVLKRISEYIETHYMEEDLAMKDVADYAYISVSYLSLILKKETGKTFIEYLTEVRIEKAKYYLIHTNLKNYEVANACGYSTPAYFSTVFKGLCGMSPSTFRKEYKPKESI